MLQPGTLWEQVRKQTEYALRSGALHPIATECTFIPDSGIEFAVRVLGHLALKEGAPNEQRGQEVESPFLPYEEELFVAEISTTHVCLLNKFNVIDHHILLITREFEDQERLLTQADFETMWVCLGEFEGLAFYNGGEEAGASQRHKHLQLVPLPLVPGTLPRIPIEPLLRRESYFGPVGRLSSLPFNHAVTHLDREELSAPDSAGERLLQRYQMMLEAVGLGPTGAGYQSGPYNLLATRDWMLLVPRARERFLSISVNALGFAGALLVRNQQELELLREKGPVVALQAVTTP